LHVILRTAGEAAVRRAALSVVLLSGAGAVDLLLDGALVRDERSGGQPEDHHESLFSEVDPSAFERTVRPGGFCHLLGGADCNGCGVWIASRAAGSVAANLVVARAGYGARSRPVAISTERAVSRR